MDPQITEQGIKFKLCDPAKLEWGRNFHKYFEMCPANDTSKLAFLLENSFGIAYELRNCYIIQNNLNSFSNSIYTTNLKQTNTASSIIFGSWQFPPEAPSFNTDFQTGLFLQKGAFKLTTGISEESVLI